MHRVRPVTTKGHYWFGNDIGVMLDQGVTLVWIKVKLNKIKISLENGDHTAPLANEERKSSQSQWFFRL